MATKEDLIRQNYHLAEDLRAAEAEIERLQSLVDLIMPIALAASPSPVAVALSKVALGQLPPTVDNLVEAVIIAEAEAQSPAENRLEEITQLEDWNHFSPGEPFIFKTNAAFGDGSKLLLQVEAPALPPDELTPAYGFALDGHGGIEPVSDGGMSEAFTIVMRSSAGRLFNSVRTTLSHLPHSQDTEPEE